MVNLASVLVQTAILIFMTMMAATFIASVGPAGSGLVAYVCIGSALVVRTYLRSRDEQGPIW